jgi:RimK-like ATP-grasp domain
MKIRQPLFLVKLLNYEYWPWWALYVPILPYLFYQAWRSGSMTYFTAANPLMEMGGFIGDSKILILDHIDTKYKPNTLFFAKISNTKTAIEVMEKQGISFPFIIKPNEGERGKGVEKITNKNALDQYLENNSENLIIQEYIDYPLELGVFYHRLPTQKQGKITSLTRKEFLAVTGNGQQTIEVLMQNNTRARFQIAAMHKRLGAGMQEVLANNEHRQLEPIGNHCRGTKFINANDKITEELRQVFDEISCNIPSFHYGRFDLRVPSWSDLYAGRNIKILELNGAVSEPAHIYDPSYQLWRAYRDLAKHWRILADICIEQRKKGIEPLPLKDVWAVTVQHFRGSSKT